MDKELKKLEERVKILEEKEELISRFLKMQSSINNVLKFLVKKKYTEKELDDALEEFSEIEKHLNDEKKEENEDEKEKNLCLNDEKK